MARPDPSDVAAYEAEFRASYVGRPPPPLEAPIELRAYDPAWPRLYQREAARIRSVLGDRVMRLEHVGSTSVPGLAAKPIVDLVLEVPDAADEAAYLPAMAAAGYVLRLREPHWHQHRLFKGPDTDINLHVFAAGSPETDQMLRFRDRLRADPADRELYLGTKRGSWPVGPGPTCSSTPTPRPRSSAPSWPTPRAPMRRRRRRRRPAAISLAAVTGDGRPMDPP